MRKSKGWETVLPECFCTVPDSVASSSPQQLAQSHTTPATSPLGFSDAGLYRIAKGACEHSGLLPQSVSEWAAFCHPSHHTSCASAEWHRLSRPDLLAACQGLSARMAGRSSSCSWRSKGGRSGHARSNHRAGVSDDDRKAHRAPSRHRKRVSTSEKPQGASHVHELHHSFQILSLLVFVPLSDCSRSFASLWLF